MLNGCVTCYPDSLISYPRSHITCHQLVYSYVPIPVLRVSSYLYQCTDMDSRLVSGYLFVSRFPFCLIDSSMLTFTAYTLPFWIVDSSMLTITAYAFPFVVC